LANFDALRAVPAARVIPGHGPLALPWPEALDTEHAYLSGLANDIKAFIARGEPVDSAAKAAGQSLRDDWLLFDDYNARNATTAFSEYEWDQ
jgi:hypothetical protein